MEKRLFLAVFLSLVVVFGFQTMFGPQKNTTKLPQTVDNKEIVVSKQDVSPAVATSPSPDLSSKTPAFEEKITTIENDKYQVRLSNKGGNIEDIYLKEYDHSLPVKAIASFEFFKNERFESAQAAGNEAMFTYKGTDWVVTKRLKLNSNYTLNYSINVKNVSANSKTLANKITQIIIDIARLDKSNVQSDWTLCEYSIKTSKNIVRKDNIKVLNDKWNKQDIASIEWMGFRDKYFVTLVKPKEPASNYEVKVLSEKELALDTNLSGIVIEPGKSADFQYTIYAGPQKLDVLGAADRSFPSVMVFSNWGWLDAVAKAIYWLLGVLHKFIPTWGLCIIAISLIVYGLMYPLTVKSLVSMKKLQALQPQMKEIQEKYKSNPEKLNKEVVELYRVNQVNPVSGCLPMFLQMPIFVGLYQVLWRSIYFRGQKFLWMQDLSLPDHTLKLPFTLPVLGEYLNILPILMIIIMGVQQGMNLKTMSAGTKEQAEQQKMMAIFFPILIGFIFYNMASGLNLYFVVFYILSTVSQWHIAKSMKTAS